jgi:hypothetical protein
VREASLRSILLNPQFDRSARFRADRAFELAYCVVARRR